MLATGACASSTAPLSQGKRDRESSAASTVMGAFPSSAAHLSQGTLDRTLSIALPAT